MAQAALTIVPRTPIACTRTRCFVISSSSSSSSPSDNSRTPTAMSFHTSLAIPRRDILSLGIAGAILGLNLCEKKEGKAAARRPPPPPPPEGKKDPNVSGVQAKVLANKKRKDAMKQNMAKLRERGNLVEQQKPSQVIEEQKPSQVIEEQQLSQVIEEQPSQESISQ